MNRYGGVAVSSIEAAAWVHDETVRSPGQLGEHVGWKCGVDGVDAALFPTAAAEEASTGSDGEDEAVRFAAPLFGASVVESGGSVVHARGGMRGVEAEIGFTLGSALPALPRQADPYSAQEVWDAVATIELCLEVCGFIQKNTTILFCEFRLKCPLFLVLFSIEKAAISIEICIYILEVMYLSRSALPGSPPFVL